MIFVAMLLFQYFIFALETRIINWLPTVCMFSECTAGRKWNFNIEHFNCDLKKRDKIFFHINSEE